MKFPEYLKSRKAIAILLIILSITADISLANIFWNKRDTQFSYIEFLYFATQIVSSVFITSGTIIAVMQYYLTSQSTKKNLSLVQIQRAIDLSEYYKDNILKYFPAIRYVFKQTEIIEIFDKIEKDKMVTFDYDELIHILSADQRKSLQEIQSSDSFTKAVLEANDIYKLDLNLHSFEVDTQPTDKDSDLKNSSQSRIAIAFMANLINATINNLEYFALHFSHNVADETVVFQSLHQSFLENIPYLYYYISKNNTNSAKKLFTNVIWLYNTWKKEEEDQINLRYQKISILTDPRPVIQKY